MNVTEFLAQIWGPVLLTIGLGVFVSRTYYVKIYNDLEKETLAVLLFGMVAMAAGIAQIKFHSEWDTFPEIVISLLGCGLLLKGIAFALVPGLVDKGGDWEVKSKLVPFSGSLMLILGAYLCWVGYFM